MQLNAEGQVRISCPAVAWACVHRWTLSACRVHPSRIRGQERTMQVEIDGKSSHMNKAGGRMAGTRPL